MNQYIYIENVIEILQELSDKEYQLNIWLNTNNPNNWIGSFIDAANTLFDDCIIGSLLEENEVIISKNITKIFQELSDIIDDIDEYRPDVEIINSPEMEMVRHKAAHILELIRASDGSESTVGFIKVGTTDVPISTQEAFKNNQLERFKI